MAEFCAADPRLIGVALATLDEPDRAIAEIEAALDLGLGALWIPADAPGGRSPGHPLHDPVWALLAERGVPFILHVGSDDLSIPYPFENVAQLVRESFPELYLFSSDYPHAEGGRDPIGRFERVTEPLSEGQRAQFFYQNFETLYPG